MVYFYLRSPWGDRVPPKYGGPKGLIFLHKIVPFWNWTLKLYLHWWCFRDIAHNYARDRDILTFLSPWVGDTSLIWPKKIKPQIPKEKLSKYLWSTNFPPFGQIREIMNMILFCVAPPKVTKASTVTCCCHRLFR